ncbi:tellurite resistance TerB family protein [Camelimonas sp. ID_303_24]
MFDARQILDALVGAAAINPQGGQPGSQGNAARNPDAQGGGLGDVLGQLTGGGQGAGGGGGGLGGLLGQMLGGGRGGSSGGSSGGEAGGGSGGGRGGGLGDLLGGLLGGGAGQGQGQAGAPQAGGTQGGAQPGGGVGGSLQDALTRMAGPQAGGLLRQAMDFAQTPKGAAILAGLAGLMLSKTGRTVSGRAAKLGGAALVGGLTYKAVQEWQAGSAPAQTEASTPVPAPAGSGFDAASQTHDGALALVQAMIAAAAADGQVDDAERAKITGALGTALPEDAVQFLNAAFANPLSPEQLADLAASPEHAAQIYEAARLTVDPDTPAEQAFLTRLKSSLGLDEGLVAHLDAAALSARA